MYNFQRQITINRPVTTKQSTGQVKETSNTLIRTCFADIKISAGNESTNFDQQRATNSYTFVVRYTTTEIKPTDFVLFEGLRIEINSVVKLANRNMFIELKGEANIK